MKFTIKDIAANAIIAALYVALTLASYPLSYDMLQFRIAEALVILCFFKRDYTVGLTLGCVIANFASSLGLLDCVLGGVATLLSCLIMSFCKHLGVAILFPVIFNGLIVGAELYFLEVAPFWVAAGWVALGEFGVIIIGYIVTILLKKNKKFFSVIRANRSLDFKW